ncbi:hypothetical protein H2248_002358 [Termitomyces sp. 'cryptogamus']|nr:hypothetical protein H2248_002358 [Termitomyces sp. 'cryptogamus']
MEVIDLTSSSSQPEIIEDLPSMSIIKSQIRSSFPVEYGSDNEYERDELRQELLIEADKFEEAARILRSQAVLQQSSIWMRHIQNHRIGSDVIDLVDDILRYEKTGRKRDTMWADGRGKVDKRRALNTIGYKTKQGVRTL